VDRREEFLARVREAPEDELLRSVYADWLDEQGEHEEADRQRKFLPARRWLREFAYELDLTYEALIQAAHDYLKSGDAYCLDFDTPDLVYEGREEFWKSFEVVTGAAVPAEKREWMFFRCAC
jgi:uncharacterized protein (TIGR02996 family)